MPLHLVKDADDPELEPFRMLRDPARVRHSENFVVEGRRLLQQVLLRRDCKVQGVLLTPQSHLALLAEGAVLAQDTPVWIAEPALLQQVAGYSFHQGTLALVQRPDLEPEQALRALLEAPMAPLLVLECVTNPDNVGALLRTALALGARGAILDSRCGDPLYRKALRNSMGAALTLPWTRVEALTLALQGARGAGYLMIGLCCEPGGLDLESFAVSPPATRPLAILVGAEGEGLSAAARAACDVCVRIPMHGQMDSLNVNAAAAIALHRLSRGRPGTTA